MLIKWGLFLFLLTVLQVSARYKSVVQNPGFLENVIEGDAVLVSSTSSRIVSGWEALPGQHPHHASLRRVSSTGEVGRCGGAIVSREWIITAAHCTARRVTLVVRAGVVDFTTPEYIFETTEWYNHPSYNDQNTNVQANDISLVKLQRPVVYTNLLRAIRVQSRANAHANYHGLRVTVTGHGNTWTSGSPTDVLRWVYLQAISNPTCLWTFASALVNNNIICARPFNVTSQSTCQGDGGGPLVYVGSNGVPTLIGVTSFRRAGNNECHGGHPNGFTRPGPYLSWFQRVTGIDFENLREDEEIDTTTTSTTTSTTTTSTTTTTTTTPSTTTTEQEPDDSFPEGDTTAQPDDTVTQEPDDSSPEDDTTAQPDDSEEQEPDDSSPEGDTTAQPDDTITQEPDDSSPEDDTTAQPDDSEEQDPDDLFPEGDTTAQPDDTVTQEPDDSSPEDDTTAQPDDSEEQEPDDSSPEGDTTAQPDDTITQEPDDSSPEDDTTAQPDDSEEQEPDDSEEKEEDKEEEGEEDSGSSECNEDDEIGQLLKRLEVYVKVKVRLDKYNVTNTVGNEINIAKH